MNIITKIKNKRQQLEIKRYYKKPSLTKIILIRGITVLLVFSIIMTGILYYMHATFVVNNEQLTSSDFDLYQKQEEKAYGNYILKNNPDYLDRLGEELGHEPTTDELNDQYTQFVRRWLNIHNIYENGSVNLYDNNFENGIMSFDKPYLSLMFRLFENPENQNSPINSYVFYTFQNDEVAAKLNEMKNTSHLDVVLIHMDGYYVKGTEFIPRDLYFGTNVSNLGFYPDLDNLFADGENYGDIQYGLIDKVIHIDTGCGTKEEMESLGYHYIDSNIRGYWGSVASELTPIYPNSSQQIDSQKIALDSFNHDALMNTTQTTEHNSISHDHSIDKWGIECISYANIVHSDPTLTNEKLNLVYRYKIQTVDKVRGNAPDFVFVKK